MNERNLANALKALKERVEAWARSDDSRPITARLAEADAELSIALEELQAADEELRRQNRALELAGQATEAERRHYQDLFQFAPDGYLVTDLDGTVHEANQAAARLLGVHERLLRGKPLAVFVAPEDRRAFRAELMQRLAEASRVEEMLVRFKPRDGAAFPAALTVGVMTTDGGAPSGLRWLMRDASQRTAEPALRMTAAVETAPPLIDERRHVLEAALPAPPVVVDADPGRPPERPTVVLIVEDNRDAADSLAYLIRLWGFQAVPAYDGASALAAASQNPPDVALIDLAMPAMDGYEVLRRLRGDLGLAPLAVAVTGFAGEEDHARICAAGFSRRMVKPVDLKELQTLLARAPVGR